MKRFLTGLGLGLVLGVLLSQVWSSRGAAPTVETPVAPVPTAQMGMAPMAAPAPPAAPAAASSANMAAPPPAALVQPALPLLPAAPVLSADHEAILSDGKNRDRPLSPPELHAKLVAEARDAQWSYTIETQLRQAMTDLGIQSPDFDVQGVDCRLTPCEIRLIGNSPGAGEAWNRAQVSLRALDWWTRAFDGTNSSANGRNGKTVIVTFMLRKRGA